MKTVPERSLLLFFLLSLVSVLFWGDSLASDIDFMGLIAMFIAISVLILNK